MEIGKMSSPESAATDGSTHRARPSRRNGFRPLGDKTDIDGRYWDDEGVLWKSQKV